MSNRVQELFNEIKRLEKELLEELQRKQEALSYEIKERAILFKDTPTC